MRIYEFFLTLVLGFVIVLVVMNKSVFSYIEQKYHIAAFDPSSPLLYALGTPARGLDSLRARLFPSQEELALNSSKETEEVAEEVDSSDLIEQVIYPLITQEGKIALEPESTFLFIGDSLMQGVGMTLGLELKKRGFSVIDIAKQSTGLTYIDFFDWGKTLKDAFAKNPHINIVVIMVGANDPYNMPKIKYASPEWVEVYQGRVRDILETANAHNAIVVWYEAPIVKKPSLNAKLAFLNTLYAREVASYKAVFLPSNVALAPDGVYTAYGKTESGKSVKLRANDGIHFSGEGSRVLGGLLLERLEVVDSSGDSNEDSALFERDSALGNHSGDFVDFLKKHRLTPSGIPCFRGTADLESSSLLKSTKSPTSNTAIPRILEEENRATSEKPADIENQPQSKKADSSDNAHLSSLRDTAPAVAWQSIQKYTNPLESIFSHNAANIMDRHAAHAARDDRKNAASKKADSSDNAHSLSLRADLSAWQSIQKSAILLESSFENNPANAPKVDSRFAGLESTLEKINA
ncbi:GDSL-type esterase/lipase family protein [Helicobacter canis]|uniref:Glycosyltransferase n=1 Tax=Helicobacter canis TaxID=29419 RepID=A0A377J2E8_9HELI|nr:GDSL-type esterase/lipase family protein [Helicobacter canis]STO96620.1 glycosyltransferase [Helicobacter canis]